MYTILNLLLVLPYYFFETGKGTFFQATHFMYLRQKDQIMANSNAEINVISKTKTEFVPSGFISIEQEE